MPVKNIFWISLHIDLPMGPHLTNGLWAKGKASISYYFLLSGLEYRLTVGARGVILDHEMEAICWGQQSNKIEKKIVSPSPWSSHSPGLLDYTWQIDKFLTCLNYSFLVFSIEVVPVFLVTVRVWMFLSPQNLYVEIPAPNGIRR